MIVLFTDFGLNGPYIGQMQASIFRFAPEAKIVNLFANAPLLNPVAGAHLLSAYVAEFAVATVFLAVVDPGVGSQRRPIVAEIDGRYFVGPDNGLFDVVAARAKTALIREIIWQPERLSASFHGRDLFAPVAAHIDNETLPDAWLAKPVQFSSEISADDLLEIIYLDDYGNAMTGLRASMIEPEVEILINGHRLKRARTFSDVERGQPFWYSNSNGLVEISVNCGSAMRQLGLSIGMPFEMVKPEQRVIDEDTSSNLI